MAGRDAPMCAPRPLIFQFCKSRTSVRQSLQNSARLGQHQGDLPIYFRGRGRKVMHLPCKQVKAGALPAVLHQF